MTCYKKLDMKDIKCAYAHNQTTRVVSRVHAWPRVILVRVICVSNACHTRLALNL